MAVILLIIAFVVRLIYIQSGLLFGVFALFYVYPARHIATRT